MTAPESPAAAAPPAPAPTPVLTDLGRLVRVLFSPTRVFEEQREHPTFWLPWIIVTVIFAALQFLQRPFQERARALLFEHLGRPAPAGPGAVAAVIGVLGTALTVLILSAIAAGIFYVLISVVGGETTYSRMMTVAIFAWPIAVLQQVLALGVLWMRGVGAIQSVWDAQVSFGLDLLMPSSASLSPFLRILLMGIGPLAIWQLAIAATGLKVLGKAKTGSAWTAAIVEWLVVLLVMSAIGGLAMGAAMKAMNG